MFATYQLSGPLSDPSGSSALVAAVSWAQGTLLGTVATTVAVIAVASIGFGMLTGRVDIRRGITVIVGCFILFGASSIVAGIEKLGSNDVEPPMVATDIPPQPSAKPSRGPTRQYDPYAGASVR